MIDQTNTLLSIYQDHNSGGWNECDCIGWQIYWGFRIEALSVIPPPSKNNSGNATGLTVEIIAQH